MNNNNNNNPNNNNSNNRDERKKKDDILPAKPSVNYLKKPSEFICTMKFRNTLPDIPFDPKFLVYPFDVHRYVRYVPTSLETSYKHPLLARPDDAIPIDLIDPDTYNPPDPKPPLSPSDEQLIRPVAASASTGREKNRPTVAWLRKTEYITSEYDKLYGQGDRADLKHQLGKQTALELEKAGEMNRNTEAQIKAIESSFQAASHPPVHPSDPSLTPTLILPIFPDFQLWPNLYSKVVFDGDPQPQSTSTGKVKNKKLEWLLNHAVLNALSHTSKNGTQQNFITYLVPKSTSHTKPHIDEDKGKEPDIEEEDLEDDDDTEGEKSEYEWVRDYFYHFKKDNEQRDTHFFVFHDDAVYYNAINSTVLLSNVKTKLSKQTSKEDGALSFDELRPTRITLTRRKIADEVQQQLEERANELNPISDFNTTTPASPSFDQNDETDE